ncbi:hypothetical protein EPUS_01581 [Endocarpon pusillum Z07020]|uniref:Uncharacterized protein n=1 Tax=Endocarpon pusillum (strain Z07020 / HMAS-L-300199) TaxID=1263415 RepID=U1GUN5_ENDPU|nr:uncharacterized protein EPUS_01581 [Endocarpon pusillum Z07020]ERF75751.1 hypothetical protein EPUS_01581 [Endocarpon pusillum Z07020]
MAFGAAPSTVPSKAAPILIVLLYPYHVLSHHDPHLVLYHPVHPNHPANHHDHDLKTVDFVSPGSDEVSLRFEAPCHGCFADGANGLIFDIAIHKATEACGNGRIHINGQEFYWLGNPAEGAGTIQTPLVNALGNRGLNATWNATWKASCINDEAQILSLQINRPAEDIINRGSGFTISFKQQEQPEIFRLVGEPLDISNPENLAAQWTHPDRPQCFTLAPTPPSTGCENLDDEYAELKALKARSHDLQKLIREKKKRIHQLLCDDFRTFCSNLSKCGSFKCVFRTMLNKLPEYAHIISLHFGHHLEGIRKQGDEPMLYGHDEINTSPEEYDDLDPSSAHYDGIPRTPLTHHDHASATPVPSQTRHLSPTMPVSPQTKHLSPSPTLHPHETGLPLPSPSHTRTPDSVPIEYTHSILFYIFRHLIPPLLLFITLCSIIFLTLRRLNLLCASPYSRALRASTREERRTRRTYRRAELQHAWRNWWNRYRHPTCTNDYEEKRTLILEQEGVLEDAMQDEIRGLQVAQEIIRDMVQAEEGRSQLYHQANFPQHQQSRQTTTEHEATPSSQSSSTTHPVFKTINPHSYSFAGHRRSTSASSSSSESTPSLPPPSYEQELDSDIDVVDGFMYTATFGSGHTHSMSEDGDGYGVDTTPDSSVVDCSPRMSFDTGRTTLTAKEGD